MEHINKCNDAAANQIIDPYLSSAQTELWFMSDDLYYHFRRVHGKRELIDNVLLPEQNYQCCYCMKHFAHSEDHDATIEHTIPRSTAVGNDFNNYFSPDYPTLTNANVCHTQDFKNGGSVPGQYPHHVAYHNFAIACNICNNNRNNTVIAFPFFMAAGQQHIYYNRRTGEISWLDDPQLFAGSSPRKYMVNIVGLNSPILKAIRATWFYIKDHAYDINQAANETKRKELIYNVFGQAIEDQNFTDIESFISLATEEQWQLFLKYSYFYTI